MRSLLDNGRPVRMSRRRSRRLGIDSSTHYVRYSSRCGMGGCGVGSMYMAESSVKLRDLIVEAVTAVAKR